MSTTLSTLTRVALLTFLVCGVFATLAPQVHAQEAPASQMTKEQIDSIAGRLHTHFMSPFCPGKNLKDCTSGQAAVWREKIRDWVAEGKSEQWIEDALIAEFGEQILSAPKFKGFNALVWIFPVLAILIGLGLIFAYLSKQHGMELDQSVAAVRNVPEDYEADDDLDDRLEAELQQRVK